MGYCRRSLVSVLLVAAVVSATSDNRQSEDSIDQWNTLVDVVLDHVKVELRARGRQEIELKDVEYTIDKKFAFVRVRGQVSAEGGWLKDVSSAYRVGNVSTERTGSKLKVTGTVSWAEMSLGYRHYRLDIGRRVIEGDLEVSARSNAVKAVFSFDRVDGECITKLEELTILDLSDLKIKIKGLGWLNFIAEQLVGWFVESRKDDLTEKLEEMFQESIPEHLEDFHCDEYAVLLMVPI